jgi:hypothetical protein
MYDINCTELEVPILLVGCKNDLHKPYSVEVALAKLFADNSCVNNE